MVPFYHLKTNSLLPFVNSKKNGVFQKKYSKRIEEVQHFAGIIQGGNQTIVMVDTLF